MIQSNGGGDTAALLVAEDTIAVTTVQAFDLDSPSIAYSIAGGADAALFAIDAASGALVFAAAPDFEAPADADGDNVYEVVVRASDGERFDDQALAVAVEAANQAVVIVSDGGGGSAALGVAEGATAVTTVAATDGDGDPVHYSIAGGADAARFTIDSDSGLLAFAAAPNHESPADADGDNVYEVIVRASDGELADTQALSITVGDVNEAPVITLLQLAGERHARSARCPRAGPIMPCSAPSIRRAMRSAGRCRARMRRSSPSMPGPAGCASTPLRTMRRPAAARAPTPID